MKIGEFSRKHGVTIDTVRHYMELGLIIPEKNGAQYEFDNKCSNDIEEVKWLKEHKFSLSEIQKLFVIKRLTNLGEEADREYYRSFFTEKRDRLVKEKEIISHVIEDIEMKIGEADIKIRKIGRRLGVPFDFLSLMQCPKCQGSLKLNTARIEDNMVMEGEIACCCGFKATIEDGIIVQDVRFERFPYIDINETNRHYIENTAPEFINLMYRNISWITKRVDFGKHGCVILEPGVGGGLLLRSINGQLDNSTLYVSVDHNLELLKYTKRYLEENTAFSGYVFICCDMLDIPMKDNRVDIICDFYGSSSYNARNPGFLIDLLGNKLKPGGIWAGGYFYFERNSRSLKKIKQDFRDYFYKENIIRSFNKSCFRTLDLSELGTASRAGASEPFFAEGDSIYILGYCGQKEETSG